MSRMSCGGILSNTERISWVILSIVSVFYRLFAENRFVAAVLKGMQSGVAAVILDVALSMGANVIKERSAVHTLILAAAFCASFFLRVNVVWIVLSAALIGIVQVLRSRKGATGA
jgi:chromate transporter